MRPRAISLFVLVVAMAGVRPVEACTCGVSGPPCEAAWRTEDIFVAEILAIEDVEGPPEIPWLSRRVRLKVLEGFRGPAAGELDVWTGRSSAACGFAFDVGQRYVIYAQRQKDGRLSTGICSRTRLVSSAGEDLEYLRSLSRAPTSTMGRILGDARWQEIREDGSSVHPLPPYTGARVIVTVGGRAFATRTGTDGNFSFDVPPGTHTLRVEVPEGQYALAGQTVTVPNTRACAAVDVFVRWDGRIRGRVISADGEPVPFFGVDLIGAASLGGPSTYPRDSARADEYGAFEFTRLPPGSYTFSVENRRGNSPSPGGGPILFRHVDGALRTIRVGAGTRTTVEDFRLPAELRVVRVSGMVIDEHGGAATRARVNVHDGNQSLGLLGAPFVTGPDGRFSVSVIAGRRYRLSVEGFDATGRYVSRGESEPFTPAHDVRDLTLRLRLNR